MSEIYVNDLRIEGSVSLNTIPRIKTFEELKSWFNVSVQSQYGWDAAPEKALVWKLVGFFITEGPAEFVSEFKAENNNEGVKDIVVIHSWNGAPALASPESITPDYNSKTGLRGMTDASGEIAFPYSKGMVYSGNKPYYGPGIIWPLCPQHLSEPKYADAVFGLGWVGGTDHMTINPVFKLTRKGNTPVSEKFTLKLFKDGIDQGVKIIFTTTESDNKGWEIVLVNESDEELGRVKFE